MFLNCSFESYTGKYTYLCMVQRKQIEKEERKIKKKPFSSVVSDYYSNNY
jgi:hypothetical protein